MIPEELKYYIGKVLCTADPNDPSKYLNYPFKRVFLVFGFTGGGKDAVINGFLKANKDFPFTKFIRTLTRHKRPTELEMHDGFFVERELFDYLKTHGRFFYWYQNYGDTEFGYDTMHLLFELAQNNVCMVGGREQNLEGLLDGIHSLFDTIPVTTIFINRPKEKIIEHIQKRGGDPEELKKRIEHIEKAWYEKPKKPMDHFIYNESLEEAIKAFAEIVKKALEQNSKAQGPALLHAPSK